METDPSDGNTAYLRLVDDHGEESLYRRYSDRLREFLQDYPPKDGFVVLVDSQDWLSLNTGYCDLVRAAIQQGVTPEEAGLPSVPANYRVFVATLSQSGTTIARASSLVKVAVNKDYEKGETAARQRLLAALGYDGGMLDADENLDLADGGQVMFEAAPDESVPGTASGFVPIAVIDKASFAPPPSAPNTDPRASTPTTPVSEPEAASPARETTTSPRLRPASEPAKGGSEVSPTMRTLLRNERLRLNLRENEVPDVLSKRDATRLRQLLRAANNGDEARTALQGFTTT